MARYVRSVPVHLCAVDLGCCVAPFAVGEQVSWSLMFISPGPDDALCLDEDDPGRLTQRWRVERDGAGLLVIDGPLVAAWAPHITPWPDPGDVELSGIFAAIVHGGYGVAVEPPSRAVGVVRRVRVVTRLQQRHTDSQLVTWVPGSTWTYDVASSAVPLDSRPPLGEALTRRVDAGLLVDLDLDGGLEPDAFTPTRSRRTRRGRGGRVLESRHPRRGSRPRAIGGAR